MFKFELSVKFFVWPLASFQLLKTYYFYASWTITPKVPHYEGELIKSVFNTRASSGPCRKRETESLSQLVARLL